MKSFLVTLSLLLGLFHLSHGEIVYKPLSIGGLYEIGQIQTGYITSSETSLKDEWVDHFGSFFSQEVHIDERLHLQVGFGGIFQFPKQEKVQVDIFGSQFKMFYVGPIAKATYSFGDIQNPYLKITAGSFPFKYNPDAANLGEYLFRSGPYPGYIMTGGFATIDGATPYVQGLHSEAHWNNFQFDLLLTTETSLPPLYNFTLTGLAKYTVADGLFEVGTGVQFKHLISVDKDKTTPRTANNAYFNQGGTYYSADVNYYRNQSTYWDGEANDTTQSADYRQNATDQKALVDASLNIVENVGRVRDFLTSIIESDTTAEAISQAQTALNGQPAYNYYTYQGTTLMGRFALDLKHLFPSDLWNSKDLRLYGEVALLGVKDYPVFYENKAERMPYMVGFNLPGFFLLDLISVQYEYYNSPHLNNFANLAEQAATPFFPNGANEHFSTTGYNNLVNKDNSSWSVLMRKELYPGCNLSVQFSKDHLRTISSEVFFGARFEPGEVLTQSEDWHWAVQISWGM